MAYHVVDLVCERANEKDWMLIFDTGGNGDLRTIIWEHPVPSAAGLVVELEIVFSPDGRILSCERRHGGLAHHRVSSPRAFTTTDVCVEALQMIGFAAGRGHAAGRPIAAHDEKFAAIVEPLRATLG